MAWGESKAWRRGSTNEKLYQALLDDSNTKPQRNAMRRKIVRPPEMPWEMSRQGLLKHLLNEQMNTRMETVDAYMQIIPPGSRSGRHRHLAEECLYVLEGSGYDLHQDCDLEVTERYEWKPQAKVRRCEWEAGDVIYIPPNTIHQHFNADPDQPARALVLKAKPMYMFMNMLFQQLVEPRPAEPAPGGVNFRARESEDDYNHAKQTARDGETNGMG